jgi:hypothetical protein
LTVANDALSVIDRNCVQYRGYGGYLSGRYGAQFFKNIVMGFAALVVKAVRKKEIRRDFKRVADAYKRFDAWRIAAALKLAYKGVP